MDRFRKSLVGIEEAVADLRTAADLLEASIQHTRELLDAGVDARELARLSGTGSRDTTIEALNTMHSALRISRAEWYRFLIEQDGMTPSDIARLTGHPRQMIKRQYDALYERPAEEPRRRS